MTSPALVSSMVSAGSAAAAQNRRDSTLGANLGDFLARFPAANDALIMVPAVSEREPCACACLPEQLQQLRR